MSTNHAKVAPLGPHQQRRGSTAPPPLKSRDSFGQPSKGPATHKPAPPPKKKPKNKIKPKYYDPRDQAYEEDEVQESYLQRWRPVIFLIVLGSLAIALGIGITWYGDNEGLRDFLVIGPGSLIIGFIMLFIGLIFVGRDLLKLHRKRAAADEAAYAEQGETRRLQTEYFIPNENGAGYRPADDAIYKETKHHIKALDKVNEEADVKEEEVLTLARPSGARDADAGAVYHVVLPTLAEAQQSETARAAHNAKGQNDASGKTDAKGQNDANGQNEASGKTDAKGQNEAQGQNDAKGQHKVKKQHSRSKFAEKSAESFESGGAVSTTGTEITHC